MQGKDDGQGDGLPLFFSIYGPGLLEASNPTQTVSFDWGEAVFVPGSPFPACRVTVAVEDRSVRLRCNMEMGVELVVPAWRRRTVLPNSYDLCFLLRKHFHSLLGVMCIESR